MPRYTLNLLGQTVNFRTDADDERIKAAKELLEERFSELEGDGSNISREKLLIFLGLGLADDLILSESKLAALEARIAELLERSC